MDTEFRALLRDFAEPDYEIACEDTLRQCLMRDEGTLEPAGHEWRASKHEDALGFAEEQRDVQ
jgi:hypothetical protein